LEAIFSDPWWICGSPIVLGIFGLLVGSFLNVVVYRKPVIMMREWLLDTGGMLGEGEVWKTVFGKPQPAELTEAGRSIDAHLESLAPLGLATPRSRCGACGHEIRWYENIPLISWVALRAKCSACKTPISVRYPQVELATGALFAAAACIVTAAAAQVDTGRTTALDYIGRGTEAFRNGDIIAATRQWSEAIRLCRLSGAADLEAQALARRGEAYRVEGFFRDAGSDLQTALAKAEQSKDQALIAASSGAKKKQKN